jgi:CheY-like chemotaxis protein
MDALPLHVDIPHLQTFTKLFKEMLKQPPTSASVSDSAPDGLRNSPPPTHSTGQLNPSQAFGRGPAKVKAAVPRKTRQRKASSRRFKRCVLVVDDVPDVTEMIGLFLKHAGYEVATADSAPAALRLAHERAFDVIISDIGMPEMNGYELAESLRRRAEYQGIPIIAVTGYSEYDDRGRALRSGFNAHLTKPIDPSELLQLMNELLG